MISVDISNVWGDISLPDLLEMEKEIFDAHVALTEDAGENSPRGWLELPERNTREGLDRILAAAEKIRSESEVCVVVGIGGCSLGARAAIELLQGSGQNRGKEPENPRIWFAGNSLSTRHWNELAAGLEGKDFSVIVISKFGTAPEPAAAFRALRWMMERKYGTDEANSRIYVVTDPEEGALGQMAREENWESFEIPGDVEEPFSVLTAAGLLPMAVAGIDIREVVSGAAEGKETYDLRSFENPVWLYAAVRNALHRKGKAIELFESFESGFGMFGRWWQQLFGASGGLFPVIGELPADLYALDRTVREGQKNLFETVVRFCPPEQKLTILADPRNPDGLNALEGKTLDTMEAMAFEKMLEDHENAGVSVITMDCGELTPAKVGELFYFLELSRGICDRMQPAVPTEG